MYQSFAMTEVPQREKFDRFADLVDEIFCPMQCQPNLADPARFNARIEATDLGNIKLAMVRASAGLIRRREADISRISDAPYLIKFQLHGEALWSQRNKDVHLRPGDFVICSTSEPYSLRFDGPYQMPVLAIDDATMHRLTPDPEQFLGQRMPHDDAACGLLTSFVAQIVQRMSALPEPMIARLESNILDLLGGVLSARGKPVRRAEITATDLIRAMKAFALDNLRNRELGPAMIAQAFNLSIRSVHKIFAPESLTFSRYIQSRRIDACYQNLIDPDYARFSITEIALYWGFYDLPHMNRCFKKTYGLTPSGVRSGMQIHSDLS